jgi:hypothetical protein
VPLACVDAALTSARTRPRHAQFDFNVSITSRPLFCPISRYLELSIRVSGRADMHDKNINLNDKNNGDAVVSDDLSPLQSSQPRRVATGVASSGKGAWRPLSGMIAQVHQGEMIIPAGPAAAFRRTMEGSSGVAGTVHRHHSLAICRQRSHCHVNRHKRDRCGHLVHLGVRRRGLNPHRLSAAATTEARTMAHGR